MIQVSEQPIPGGTSKRHVYYYVIKEWGVETPQQLGIRKSAIQRLIDQVDGQRKLREMIDCQLDELEEVGRLPEAKALLLAYFKTGAYAQKAWTDGQGNVQTRIPMEHVVLRDFYERKFGASTADGEDVGALLSDLGTFSQVAADGHRVLKPVSRPGS